MLAVLGATACQPIPQPFQPSASKKSGNPLLGGGIAVRPVAGLRGRAGQRLAEKIAGALVQRDIIAFAGTGNSRSKILFGAVTARPESDGFRQIEIGWNVLNAPNKVGKKALLNLRVPSADWLQGDEHLLDRIARQSANKIVALVQTTAPVEKIADRPKRNLHVSAITGAPPEAGTLLRSELETALSQRSIRVSPQQREGSLVVAGAITLELADKNVRKISIDWSLLRPDGSELGRLRQENKIADEELEENWPQVARNIAVATANGLRDLLRRIPNAALSHPAAPR
jgi:hypothetical protein|tara:strand:+ start:21 stop:878 length:858 start_codon:yes stop_codon:yes gene_type:complete